MKINNVSTNRFFDDTVAASIGAAIGAVIFAVIVAATSAIPSIVPIGLVLGSLTGVAFKELLHLKSKKSNPQYQHPHSLAKKPLLKKSRKKKLVSKS